MGLDWIAESKPIKGNEIEYSKLKRKIKTSKYYGSDEMELLKKQLENISISPQDTIDKNQIDIEDCFRGKLILNSSILNEELSSEALCSYNPEYCIDYAERLEIYISSYNKDELDGYDLCEYNTVLQAIKWLKFWGNNGHGYEASY